MIRSVAFAASVVHKGPVVLLGPNVSFFPAVHGDPPEGLLRLPFCLLLLRPDIPYGGFHSLASVWYVKDAKKIGAPLFCGLVIFRRQKRVGRATSAHRDTTGKCQPLIREHPEKVVVLILSDAEVL